MSYIQQRYDFILNTDVLATVRNVWYLLIAVMPDLWLSLFCCILPDYESQISKWHYWVAYKWTLEYNLILSFWLLQVHNGVYILRIISCAYAAFETLVGETFPTKPWQDVNLCSTLFLSNFSTHSCSFWRSYLWVVKSYSADWLIGTCKAGYLS
jgi:hypothetical protein